MSAFVVISGMSGAGRSHAANNLEDRGWFVMDNLPPSLIGKVADLAGAPAAGIDRLALVVGTGRYHDEIVAMIEGLRQGFEGLRILFLDASTDVLVRRYESTRRRHPFADADAAAAATLAEAIEAERSALEPVRAGADVVIDTSDLNIHQLRDRMAELFGAGESQAMRITVLSFGYSHGIPLDVDIVIDCRFLPNPHYCDDLRPLSGLDAVVADYVKRQPVTGEFLARFEALLQLLVPQYVAEGKAYLTVAFGCTGGRHRSVAVTEHFARVVAAMGYEPSVVHRDIDKQL
ncbi:MAG: RNase adapter RapZ [Acidimicrobiaceae bacterium]|nr:RNase adapter RapZ [Acidimicrobiaceae bacterium]MCY4279617.1 RNase adapter RapZ [Acidimicrobiaceae bacterium]MCY4295138.1 RNase adapter RapZ [Acidimicrobiaceae bacterium]